MVPWGLKEIALKTVPNGAHPILLKHLKELGGLKYHLARKRLELVPHASLGLLLGGPAP